MAEKGIKISLKSEVLKKFSVYNAKGESVGSISLNPKIFNQTGSGSGLVHQAVNVLLSGSRNLVASAKDRGQVRGGGKKPWRQKGTGRARAGSIRSPLWRGGGVTFGPQPNRNYSRKMNKRDRRIALFRVLTDKARGNKLFVVEKFEIEPKTKNVLKYIEDLQKKVKDLKGSTLFVTAEKNDKLIRATRNLPKISTKMASGFNILDVMTHESLVLEKEALKVVENTYLKEK